MRIPAIWCLFTLRPAWFDSTDSSGRQMRRTSASTHGRVGVPTVLSPSKLPRVLFGRIPRAAPRAATSTTVRTVRRSKHRHRPTALETDRKSKGRSVTKTKHKVSAFSRRPGILKGLCPLSGLLVTFRPGEKSPRSPGARSPRGIESKPLPFAPGGRKDTCQAGCRTTKEPPWRVVHFVVWYCNQPT